MSENKIINNGEIDLKNLFRHIWVNKFGIFIIFLISFALSSAYEKNSPDKYKFSIKLEEGNRNLSDKYIFFNYSLTVFKYNSFDLKSIIFSNFEEIVQTKESISSFMENNASDIKNLNNIEFSILPNEKKKKYELQLYHDNFHEGKKILESFVSHILEKTKKKTIYDLETIILEVKKISVFEKNELDLDKISNQYISLFKNESIDKWFSSNSSEVIVSDLKNSNLIYLKSIIFTTIIAIVYLFLINRTNILSKPRKKYD